MPRIKKRGLDYFPMNTDFIHDRMVRRIMKREGDASLTILLGTLSCVYSGEGYYVRADELFYDDLSDCLFQQGADDVHRVVELAVEYGLFHGGLFARYGILTSADIQRQFLFSTKRRDTHLIDPAYLLLEPGELNALAAGRKKKTRKTAEKTLLADGGVAEAGTQNACFNVENADSMYLGTHSIAQHSIEKHSIAQQSEAQNSKEQQTTAKATAEDERGKEGRCFFLQDEEDENPVVVAVESGLVRGDDASPAVAAAESELVRGDGSPVVVASESELVRGDASSAVVASELGLVHGDGSSSSAVVASESGLVRADDASPGAKQGRSKPICELTAEDLDHLSSPQDGQKRNLTGLLESLRLNKIPVAEQYAIILKSNFGIIGHPVWKGICTLRESHGKIRLPGRYLLSLINRPNG